MSQQKNEVIIPRIVQDMIELSDDSLFLLNSDFQILLCSSSAKLLMPEVSMNQGCFYRDIFPEIASQSFEESKMEDTLTLKGYNIERNLQINHLIKPLDYGFLVKTTKNPFGGHAHHTSDLQPEAKEIQSQLDLYKLLVSISNSFSQVTKEKWSATVQNSLQVLGEFIGADRVYIFDYEWNVNNFSNTFEWCKEGIDSKLEHFQDVSLEGLDDWTANHLNGKSYDVPEVQELDQNSNLRELLEPHGIQSLLTTPLMLEDNYIGFIGLDSVKSTHVFTEKESSLLQVFSITLLQAYKRLENEKEIKLRVNELNLISEISNLIHLSDKADSELFQEIALLIPSGFLNPKTTFASFSYAGRTFKSQGFKKTENSIEANFLSVSKFLGKLEVYIPAESSFSLEERSLINTIYQTLSQHVLAKEQLAELAQTNIRLDRLMDAQANYVIRTDLKGNQNYWNKKYEEDFGHLYRPNNQVKGNLLLSISELHRKKAFETVQTCISNPGKIIQVELDKMLESGEFVATLWDFVCIADCSGSPLEIQGVGVNISELISMEKRLRENEERFRILAEHIESVIWELDSEGMYTYVSPTAEKVWGYKPEELIGKKYFYELAPNRLGKKYKKEGLKFIRNKNALSGIEILLEKSDGTEIWVNSFGQPMLNAEGRLLGYRGADYDISSRKKAEEELGRFKMITEKTNHGIILVNAKDHTIQFANQSFGKMHGYDCNDLIGENSRLFDGELPKGLLEAECWNDKLELDFKECLREKKSGATFPALISANLFFEEDGKPLFYALQVIDISKQKELENQVHLKDERLKAITQAIPDLVFVSDDIGNYVEYYSSKVENTIGDYSYLLGKNVLEVFDEETAKLHLEKIQDCIQTKKIISYDYHGVEGEEDRSFECRNVYLQEDRVLRFIREITDRKRIEKELLELNEHLEMRIEERTQELIALNSELLTARNEADQANKIKSEFLSRMSHELRTPMNSILGFSQVLELSALNSAQNKNLQYIMKSGNHLLHLINEVLDISKIEAGKMSLNFEAIDISMLLQEVILMVTPFANIKSVQIELVILADKRIIAHADLHKTRQIFLNLLNNAIKFNHEGGWVKIKLNKKIQILDSSQSLLVEFQDSGFGIAQGDLGKLFKPFERVGLESKMMEGTGLGLCLVDQFVKLMEGRIGVESEVGKGSNFWIELPISEQEKFATEEQRRILDLKDIENLTLETTVLLIEDNYSNIELIEEILRQVYPSVRLITSIYGMDAYRLAKVHRPSLILLDLNLPDIHGKEVLETLKSTKDKDTEQIPVVVVSADCSQMLQEEILNSGAEQFVLKPIEMAELVQTFETYLK